MLFRYGEAGGRVRKHGPSVDQLDAFTESLVANFLSKPIDGIPPADTVSTLPEGLKDMQASLPA